MADLPKIVIFSHDVRLAETRGWVLQKAGFRVVQARDLAGAGESLAAEGAELVILCHTLTPEDQQRALTSIHKLRPQARTLVMVGESPSFEEDPHVAILSAFAGPKALIDATRKLAMPLAF